MEHTPGPWTISLSRAGLTISLGQWDIAHILGQGRKADANARLIASAPALLEALEGLLDSGRGSDEIAHALDIPIERIWQARAAIEAAIEATK
ncbi:hypothetical protein LCGC14_2212630 [marine sediment metagenome]|uniref:Uncharacterized protein n=1 Tax=marine sediment metagenome TaxID=412755 RepID=A0A0F9DD83_9ZZZZ